MFRKVDSIDGFADDGAVLGQILEPMGLTEDAPFIRYAWLRRQRHNETFKWTSENVQKIINLNDSLKEVQSALVDRAEGILHRTRQMVTDGIIPCDSFPRVSFFVCIRGEAVLDREPSSLEERSFYKDMAYLLSLSSFRFPAEEIARIVCNASFPSKRKDGGSYMERNVLVNGFPLILQSVWTYSDQEKLEASVFNRPELKDVDICLLMHIFFNQGLFSLKDAVSVNPEDVAVQTLIGA